MINFDNMYNHVNAKRLHIAFCLESEQKAKQSLYRQAVLNATIKSKFPTEMLLPAATRHMVDLLHAAAQQGFDTTSSPSVACGHSAKGT